MVYTQLTERVKTIEFVFMYEVLGKVIRRTFKAVIPIWGAYRPTDSTGDCGKW